MTLISPPESAGSARVACAGTNITVGIRLETISKKGVDDGEAIVVSLDVTQNALQSLPLDPSLSLQSHAQALLSPLRDHPQLTIVPNSKYWQLNIDIAVLSAAGGGNLDDILGIALKGALYDLRIPKTREVVHKRSGNPENPTTGVENVQDGEGGIKTLLKARKAAVQSRSGQTSGSATDFELLEYDPESGDVLRDREDFPISLTLNMTPNTYQPFLDATLHESYCSLVRLHVAYSQKSQFLSVNQVPTDNARVSQGPGALGSEIHFHKLSTLLDQSEELCISLLASLHEGLQSPAISNGGVRLAAYA